MLGVQLMGYLHLDVFCILQYLKTLKAIQLQLQFYAQWILCIYPRLSPEWLMIIVTPWPQAPPLLPSRHLWAATIRIMSVNISHGVWRSFQQPGQRSASKYMFRTLSMEIIIPPSYWPHGWEWCYCSWAEDIWSRLRSPALNISALFLLPVNRYDSSLAKLTVMIQADPLTYLEFPM